VIAFIVDFGPIWQGDDMKPSEMAARFAAFAWYAEHRRATSRIVRNEAGRFSSQNWQYFLLAVHKGWGRLLLRVAKARGHRRHPPAVVNRPSKRQLTATG
jgi:hypothetical protein